MQPRYRTRQWVEVKQRGRLYVGQVYSVTTFHDPSKQPRYGIQFPEWRKAYPESAIVRYAP